MTAAERYRFDDFTTEDLLDEPGGERTSAECAATRLFGGSWPAEDEGDAEEEEGGEDE